MGPVHKALAILYTCSILFYQMDSPGLHHRLLYMIQQEFHLLNQNRLLDTVTKSLKTVRFWDVVERAKLGQWKKCWTFGDSTSNFQAWLTCAKFGASRLALDWIQVGAPTDACAVNTIIMFKKSQCKCTCRIIFLKFEANWTTKISTIWIWAQPRKRVYNFQNKGMRKLIENTVFPKRYNQVSFFI